MLPNPNSIDVTASGPEDQLAGLILMPGVRGELTFVFIYSLFFFLFVSVADNCQRELATN